MNEDMAAEEAQEMRSPLVRPKQGMQEEHKVARSSTHHDLENSMDESSQFRPSQMIDLWKNLQDLLKNQCKEEIQVVRERNKKLQ